MRVPGRWVNNLAQEARCPAALAKRTRNGSVPDEYTLVIPTYNRSQLLAALLRFLAAEGADFPIIVLDSSNPEHRERNRSLAAQSSLKLEYFEYDEATHPFDKFRDGVHRIQTPLGSLCADDDLVLVDGLRRCIRYLSEHPDVCVAHGYYFTFLDQGGAGFDLTSMLYFTPGIDHDDPLWRLRILLRNYQALTYGVYRTPVLQAVFDGIQPVRSLLARELLSGALSVIRGKVARLRCFYGGRSQGPAEWHIHWHPLEWLIRNPREFLQEYVRYREILLRELARLPTNKLSPEETERIVDLIHAFYVIAHAPRVTHDFILDHVMAGVPFDHFWPHPVIQNHLLLAHYAAPPFRRTTEPGRLWRWTSRVFTRVSSHLAPSKPPPESTEIWPKTASTSKRTYRMHKSFLDFEPKELVISGADEIAALLASLDHYSDTA